MINSPVQYLKNQPLSSLDVLESVKNTLKDPQFQVTLKTKTDLMPPENNLQLPGHTT